MRKLTKEEKTLMYKLQYIARGGAEGARLRQKKWRDKKKHAKNKTTNLHRKKQNKCRRLPYKTV